MHVHADACVLMIEALTYLVFREQRVAYAGKQHHRNKKRNKRPYLHDGYLCISVSVCAILRG